MLYTPPRYVTDIEVARGDHLVFAMTGDISLATDPVIDFLYRTGSGRRSPSRSPTAMASAGPRSSRGRR